MRQHSGCQSCQSETSISAHQRVEELDDESRSKSGYCDRVGVLCDVPHSELRRTLHPLDRPCYKDCLQYHDSCSEAVIAVRTGQGIEFRTLRWQCHDGLPLFSTN